MPETSPEAHPRLRRRPHAITSGALWGAAGAPIAVVGNLHASWLEAPRWLQGASIATALLLLIAALQLPRRVSVGRWLGSIGAVALLVLGAPFLRHSPQAALASAIATATLLGAMWEVGSSVLDLRRLRRRPLLEGQAQGVALATVALTLCFGLFDASKSHFDYGALLWSLGSSVIFVLEWCLRCPRMLRWRRHVLLASHLFLAILSMSFWGQWWWMFSTMSLSAFVVVIVVRTPARLPFGHTSAWEGLSGHPERLFVGTFFAMCIGGTLLLALPQSSTSGKSMGLLDAAFTSTSAVCVTGLSVVDTPVDLSLLGQGIVLLLIQIGGLGIMTFSTAALWILGRRLSMRHEGAVASLISPRDRGHLFSTAQRILLLTLVTEALGAIVLALAFWGHGDDFAMGLWRGVFTSISAFCNAGFALQSDSLVSYQHVPLVLHTVSLLIIVGGLSPIALFALPLIATRSARPISAQARLALVATAVLLVVAFVCYLAFEWNDSLSHLGLADKIHNAWFQSATLRTAGFNSVDLSIVRPATYSLMLVWMFIGGNPGGTAGGVKTTTVSVLFLSVIQAIRGSWTLEVFGRRISERSRAKAAVIIAVAMGAGMLALLAVQLTQPMSMRLAVFEVVSAMGTVGLSIGGTGELDGFGKAVIIGAMFVGRVGGLSLLMLVSSRRAPPSLGRPEEDVDVG